MNSCKAARNSCGWSVCSKWPASGMCCTVEQGNNLCILGSELSLRKKKGEEEATNFPLLLNPIIGNYPRVFP